MELIDKAALIESLPLEYASVMNAINEAPLIDAVEVVHGEWLLDTQFATKSKYRCSLCERLIMGSVENPNIKFPYCHCGAKMDGKRRESEVSP